MQKKLDKIQHLFMIKDVKKQGIEGMNINLIKGMYTSL
jgi:hypothetical protein